MVREAAFCPMMMMIIVDVEYDLKVAACYLDRTVQEIVVVQYGLQLHYSTLVFDLV